jgi:hypothetical protein
MGEKGIDISEWQAGMDVERVCRENDISFVFVRSNYGSQHDDLQFHRHCDGAERADAIVTPYVYPLATDTRGSIDDAVRIAGERYRRIAIDWEHGSGGGDHLRAAHERAWEHGLDTRVVYDPAWYYQQQGSPNVNWMGESKRIQAHWKSWYPDNIADTFENILRKLSASVWNDNRGGIPTKIVQFTSSAILKGWGGKLDANWFQGSHDELVALLIGEDDMPSAQEIADTLLGTWLTDARPGVPDDQRRPTTVGNAIWSTWHTVHFGDPINNNYPSTKDILNAVEAGGLVVSPEHVAAIADQIKASLTERIAQSQQMALQGMEGIISGVPGKIGFAKKPQSQ